MASDKGRFGVPNVLSLRPVITTLFIGESMDYGAETTAAHKARREVRWTPLLAESL